MYVFDFEVFKYNWLVVFKKVSTNEYTIIQDNPDELLKFYEKNKQSLFFGFNNKNYDNVVFKGILSGVDPYEISRMIIEGRPAYYVSKALGIKNY